MPRVHDPSYKNKRFQPPETPILNGGTPAKRFAPEAEFYSQKVTTNFSNIGGYEIQKEEAIASAFSLKNSKIDNKFKHTPFKCVLFHGPRGTGKTSFTRALAGEFDLPLFSVSSTDLISGISGESEKNIRKLFSEASNNAPCIIFLDEIDVIAAKRENTQRDMGQRIISQLNASIDELEGGQVLVVGATRRLEALDDSLQKRFEKKILLGIPDENERLKILETITRTIDAIPSNFFIATETKEERVKRAQYNSEKMKQLMLNCEDLDDSQLEDLRIEMDDFLASLRTVIPTIKQGGFVSVSDVTWNDIGALKEVRDELKWSILHPIQHPEYFKVLNEKPQAEGILLCGPPGCGKTLLAKAISNETGLNFLSVKGPELLNMYVGESERAVRTLFQRARDSEPSVIFFDEIDSLCSKRVNSESAGARLVNQLLTEMNGMESRKQVYLIGATNRPDMLDPAVLRPGRLDKIIFVDFPNAEDRVDILKKTTKDGQCPRLDSTVNLELIANNPKLQFFTGADLVALINKARNIALRQIIEMNESNITAIMPEHFELAMQLVQPSVGKKDRIRYAKLKKIFGSKHKKL